MKALGEWRLVKYYCVAMNDIREDSVVFIHDNLYAEQLPPNCMLGAAYMGWTHGVSVDAIKEGEYGFIDVRVTE